ncbi:hypothetical protein BBI00_07615 [Chryseobacterium arthrosphaerae]|uniref:Uncharacterized protein n=1 Tax=Chryseobacterium arthrosphaerae TaxID=651561 RepID=A0A1B8ZRJ6_9FLAO|nr:hypothetical protein BBI00_07615 [Chryseobacterium arthrosphaerae]
MKRIPQIIFIISTLFIVDFLFFPYFDVLELIPLVIILLAINFYLIYRYNNNKVISYILNGLLLILLIICFAFGAILRQDWNFIG